MVLNTLLLAIYKLVFANKIWHNTPTLKQHYSANNQLSQTRTIGACSTSTSYTIIRAHISNWRNIVKIVLVVAIARVIYIGTRYISVVGMVHISTLGLGDMKMGGSECTVNTHYAVLASMALVRESMHAVKQLAIAYIYRSGNKIFLLLSRALSKQEEFRIFKYISRRLYMPYLYSFTDRGTVRRYTPTTFATYQAPYGNIASIIAFLLIYRYHQTINISIPLSIVALMN
ncbi:hypothetical protein ACJX0J_029466 [Zea mays]